MNKNYGFILLSVLLTFLAMPCFANETMNFKCGKKLVLPDGFEKMEQQGKHTAYMDSKNANIIIEETDMGADFQKENNSEFASILEAALIKAFKDNGHKVVSSEKRVSRNGYPLLLLTLEKQVGTKTAYQKAIVIAVDSYQIITCLTCTKESAGEYTQVISMLERQFYGF